tara:strand:+ start:200 stop:676 length:477 start_codon:yes stop_codon:yes gene_type:complete
MFFVFVSLQFVCGWFYGHILEYFLHRVMHDYKRFPFFFKHHFSGHHKLSRQNEMRDESYDNIYKKSSLFECIGLLIGILFHLPVLYFFPFAYIALLVGAAQYYWMHRKSHIDVDWGKKHMPWHYDHHMAKNQHDNWGVRSNIIDRIYKAINKKNLVET